MQNSSNPKKTKKYTKISSSQPLTDRKKSDKLKPSSFMTQGNDDEYL